MPLQQSASPDEQRATRHQAAHSRAAVQPPSFQGAALLESVLPQAYRVARCLAGNAADAEDLVQEAALSALRGLDGFEPGTNFKAWFLRILTNAFYMKCRRDKRHPEVTSGEEAPDLYLFGKTGAATAAEDGTDPARAFLSRLESEQVAAAIQALPPDFRSVASLYFLEDLSYEAIASVLDCPVGTVRSRLHRGRKMLQVALWQVAQDHGLV